MFNDSLAAQAVAQGPLSVAPPSFNGHGWLVAINLGFFTAVFIIGGMLAWEQVKQLWRNRHRDARGEPVTIWRWMGFCLFFAGMLRGGSAAAMLWKWDPLDPTGTAWALTMQRFIDPVALLFGLTAMALFTLAAPGMVQQLRREPLPVDIWLSLPKLRRPMLIFLTSIVTAIAVVSLR